jgi:hypothetical protein
MRENLERIKLLFENKNNQQAAATKVKETMHTCRRWQVAKQKLVEESKSKFEDLNLKPH